MGVPFAAVVRRWAVRVAVHGGVAVATTFPLVVHLGDRLPIGREPSATVPFFNLWSLTWTASGSRTCSPGGGTRRSSSRPGACTPTAELQPLTGLTYMLLRPVTGAVAAYGVILLLALAANGIAAGVLARRLGASEGAVDRRRGARPGGAVRVRGSSGCCSC